MPPADNVRNLYRDGGILGAEQLTADQVYVRAALERRSLSRDVFGVAFGLELTVETAPQNATTSAVLRVEPGVAYGGDGKPIVLRERTEVSSLLKNKDPKYAWAIYIAQIETTQADASRFSFCGQEMNPKLAEEAVLSVESFPPSTAERPGARVPPHGQLGGPAAANLNRVCLGVVDIDANGIPKIRRVPGNVEIPEPPTTPTAAELELRKAPVSNAEYAGVVASGIVHPRAFTRSLGATLAPAIQLEPEGGVRMRQRTRFDADAHASGMLVVGGALVAESGVAVVLPVATGGTAAALLNKAVAWRTDGVAAAMTTPPNAAPSESQRVLGVATEPWGAATDKVVVVFSGFASVDLDGAAPEVGGWLELSANGSGKLKSTAAPTTGSLVAKYFEGPDNSRVRVLVCLG